MSERVPATQPDNAAARLEHALLELDVSSEVLRADPSGRSWLPAALWEEVQADADARRALREFIDFELEMFDDARKGSDALFTAQVMRSLPRGERPDGMRRQVILAAAHALAIGVAYLALWPLYDGGYFQPWVSSAQSLVDDGVQSAGMVGLAGLGGLVAVGVVLLTLALLPNLGSGQLGREA